MISYKDMLAAADAAVPRLTPAQVKEMMAGGNVLVVDVRDGTEVAQTGKIKGAVHVARGSLEGRADPDVPSYNPAFKRDQAVILHCAGGGRAALAGKTLKDMGYEKVFNAGEFKDLAGAGIEVEKALTRPARAQKAKGARRRGGVRAPGLSSCQRGCRGGSALCLGTLRSVSGFAHLGAKVQSVVNLCSTLSVFVLLHAGEFSRSAPLTTADCRGFALLQPAFSSDFGLSRRTPGIFSVRRSAPCHGGSKAAPWCSPGSQPSVPSRRATVLHWC